MLGEIWDVYDAARRRTGAAARRGEPLPPGGYHLVVHVCLFSPDGRMLIQKRSREKRSWAGLWDLSSGGCALAGEESAGAAARELFEELGLEAGPALERPALSVSFDQGFDDMYLLDMPEELPGLRLQAEEVESVRWAEKSEILELLRSGLFVPYHRSLVELLFDTHRFGGGLGRWEKQI